MAKNYMGVNLTGKSLMHYRTKGSRNGYSKDPNYRPVGSKAVGKIENGRYVYYTNTPDAKGNNWQQRGNLHRAINEVGQRAETGTTSAYNGFGTTKQSQMAADDASKRYTGGFGYDRSYANASARVAAGKRVTTPQRIQVASAKSKRDKAIAKGAANNWQQQAAVEANSHMQRNRLVEGKARAYAIAPKSLNGKVITVENNNSAARAHQNAVNQANAEARARNAIANRGSSGVRKMSKPGINYANDARFQRSETQNKVINKAMKQKDAKFRAAGIPSDQKFDAAYRRGVENEVAATTRDKLQEAEGIARYKADVDKQWRESHKIKAAVKDAKIKASQTAHKAKKETKKLINKGKNTVDNILNKLKKNKKK